MPNEIPELTKCSPPYWLTDPPNPHCVYCPPGDRWGGNLLNDCYRDPSQSQPKRPPVAPIAAQPHPTLLKYATWFDQKIVYPFERWLGLL